MVVVAVGAAVAVGVAVALVVAVADRLAPLVNRPPRPVASRRTGLSGYMKQRMIIEIETMDGHEFVTAYIEGNGVKSCKTVPSCGDLAVAISRAALLSARTVHKQTPRAYYSTVPGLESSWK